MRITPSSLRRVTNNAVLRGRARPSQWLVRAQALGTARNYSGPALPADSTEPMSEAQRNLIRKYTKPGDSFVDVACMYRADGAAAFLAEELGASPVTATDTLKPTARYEQLAADAGSRVRFVWADITTAAAIEAIGTHDVVYCCGLLYHMPDPHHTLAQLRRLSSRTLIVGTKSIPEIPGYPGAAVYFPALDPKARMTYQPITDPEGLAFRADRTPTANWFWGLSPSAFEAMAVEAGWAIVETVKLPWSGRYDDVLVVAERA
ncbi:MAG: tRNA (mo5U34)-methyltransferase [Actinomycetota bacterium]|jgi:SAM-dependent methyltransferase